MTFALFLAPLQEPPFAKENTPINDLMGVILMSAGFHVRQRGKKGQWYAVLNNGTKPDGSRNLQWIKLEPNPPNREEAEKMARKIAVKRDDGDLPKNTGVTVGEWMDKWMALAIEPRCPMTTVVNYRCRINRYIKPHLGKIQLSKLTGLCIDEFYAAITKSPSRPKGLGVRSMRLIHTILNSAMKRAVKATLIPRNPVETATTPPRPRRTKRPVLNEVAVHQYLAALEGSEFYAPVLFMVYTGLRRGEVLGMKWDDVDLDRGIVSVRGNLQRANREFILKEVKSESGERSIPLPPVVVEILLRHRADQEKRRETAKSDWEDNDLVFDRGDGKPRVPSSFSTQLRRLGVKYDFATVTPHAVRRTNASLLVRAGVPIRTIQSRLGHRDTATTLIYVQEFAEDEAEATVRLDNLLQQGAKKVKRQQPNGLH